MAYDPPVRPDFDRNSLHELLKLLPNEQGFVEAVALATELDVQCHLFWKTLTPTTHFSSLGCLCVGCVSGCRCVLCVYGKHRQPCGWHTFCAFL